MEPNICFVCLSNADNLFHDEHYSSLYLKFWKLTKSYFGISSPVTNDHEVINRRATFCENCEAVVSSICQLHQQLAAIQLHLSSKLGEFGELLENSQLKDCEWISSNSSSSVIISLSKQLGVENPTVVDTFRSYLKKKCELEKSKSLPLVLVQRLGSGPPISISEENQKTGDGDDNSFVDLERNGFPSNTFQFQNRTTRLLEMHENENPNFNHLSAQENSVSCAPRLSLLEEVGGASYFVKTEPLDEATLSRFIDEDEDDASFDPTCEQASAAIYSNLSTTKDNSGSFFCSKCYATFTTAHNLQQHMNSIHNDLLELGSGGGSLTSRAKAKGTKFLCRICRKDYSSRGSLLQHVKRLHSKKHLLSCPKCSVSFSCKQNLQGHLDAIHNPKPHVCQHCERVYPSKRYLQEHMRRSHPHSNPPRNDNDVTTTKIKKFQDGTDQKDDESTATQSQMSCFYS